MSHHEDADELTQSIEQQVEYFMDESNDGQADSSAPSTQHGIESGSLINQHHYYVHVLPIIIIALMLLL
jgi:hypothetical protein